MKKKTISVLVLIPSLLLALFDSTTLSSPQTTIYVNPPSITVTLSEDFTVDINVEGATDLYGWQFWLRWDPELLDFVAFNGHTDYGAVNQSEGWVRGTDVFSPPLSGSGTLANVTFHGVSLGGCVLDLYNTKLIDSSPVLVPTPPYLGDATGDLLVEAFDLVRVVGDLDPGYNPNSDFNNDSVVDLYDLMCVEFNFGRDYQQVDQAEQPVEITHEINNGYATILAPANIIQPYEFVFSTLWEPKTVDPAWSYDEASQELISNVYDRLIRFDGEHTDRSVPSIATDWFSGEDDKKFTFRIRGTSGDHNLGELEKGHYVEVVPWTAVEWFVERHDDNNGNGVIDSGDDLVLTRKEVEGPSRTWIPVLFPISEEFHVNGGDGVLDLTATPVVTHNYATLTPSDIEYTFERLLVHDKDPAWMLYEPLLGCYGANLTDPDFGKKIDNAIESDATHVWFNLQEPYPEEVFLQILSQPFCSIVNEDWCIEHGDWDPETDPLNKSTGDWTKYHDLEVSPLDDPDPVMMGTGPYKFDAWVKGSGGYWTIIKNDDYWGGWPAESSRGYVERATKKFIDEWYERELMFLAGDIDYCYVPRQYMESVWAQSGIECVYPLTPLSLDAMFFNYNISTESPYCGDSPLDPGELYQSGIPVDFFSDIDVRKAFAYSFDYYRFIEEICWGEALFPVGPLAEGLVPDFRRPPEWYAANEYVLDLAKAEAHFRNAWGGRLWDEGFTVTICYNVGDEEMRAAAEILEMNVEALNPTRFHIDTAETALDPGELPLYFASSFSSSTDPHHFIYNFMGICGLFARHQSVQYTEVGGNEYVNNLLYEAFFEPDNNVRKTKYYELQQIYFDECPSVCLCQPLERHWQRDWVQGWTYNPLYPSINFYPTWKEDLPREDIDSDGVVSVMDVVIMALAFGSFYEVGYVHPNWNSGVDLNQDQVIDIFDVVMICKKFGYVAPSWTPPS